MPARDYLLTGRKTCPKCKVEGPLSIFRAMKSRGTTYYSLCKECHNKSSYGWRSRNPGAYEASHARSELKRKPKASRYSAEVRAALKDEVFRAYGDECACCGETHRDFFTIDHIGGDGAQHKREIGRGNLYPWLKRMGFPKDNFQILCFNCNCAKGFRGVCPHEVARYELPYAVNVPQEVF